MPLILPPLSLYIHIPWCIRKCPYCDFNSHEKNAAMPEAEYVQALMQDLEQDRELAQGRKITSVFFGGGTPSIFSAESIGKILNHVEKIIGFVPNAEITLEANPGTFEQEKFRGFFLAGVNRLSIGIQSFNDEQLHALGRVHDRGQALRAVDMARRAGFDNINLDLMHGLPQQTLEAATADLTQAIALAPEHLSWYQLTIEKNTHFYSAPPTLPHEDILADIQDAGQTLIRDAGFAQYEVSAYAKPERQAAHNLNYWQYGDYLGIGAGAHAKISLPETQHIVRFWKTRLPQHYLDAQQKILNAAEKIYLVETQDHKNIFAPAHRNSFVGGSEVLEKQNLPLDFLMNGLRLNEGVLQEIFLTRTGLTLKDLEPQWSQLIQQQLINGESGIIRTTELGHRFLNRVLETFATEN